MQLSDRDWRVIQSIPLFADFTTEEIRPLLNGNGVYTLHKDEVLYRLGQNAQAFFVLLQGKIKLSRNTVDGLEAILGVFNSGESFAECDTFQGVGYSTNATALISSRVVRIDTERLKDKIRERPEIAFLMMGAASRFVKDMAKQIELMKIQSVVRRTAEYLLSLLPEDARVHEIVLPYEKAIIANRLGMSPESLSRSLASLKDVGVCVDKSTIVIEDREALFLYISTGEFAKRHIST